MNDDLLPVRAITTDVHAAGQLVPASMAVAAQRGYRSVVNNRPDFEGGADQPTSASIEAAARAAGLEYRFLPVSGAWQSPAEADALAALLDELPRPVLLFCRSGARSTRLFIAATQR